MLRALVVDDEELARRGLEIRLRELDGIDVCGHARNGREALGAVAELKPDIVFLDIQMPGMDGFDVLREIAGPDMPLVIFVTAYSEYAIRAFEENALDYLLKPIDAPRLEAAVQRAAEHLELSEVMHQRSRLLKLICDLTGEELSLEQALSGQSVETSLRPSHLSIKDGRETTHVSIGDIVWIDAAGDYLCIHTLEETHILRGTMKKLEEILDPARFVRVHRSTIVNGQHVKSMRSHTNGEYFLTLDCDKELKLSRTYRKNAERLGASSAM
jgi:two-component system LytT family response regulator